MKNSDNIFDFFDNIFSDEVSKIDDSLSENDIYKEISDNYLILLKELGIESFNFFRFAGYDYCREIVVDGKEYDLDIAFSHDDADATEALCAIDSLIADLDDNEEVILKTVEEIINKR